MDDVSSVDDSLRIGSKWKKIEGLDSPLVNHLPDITWIMAEEEDLAYILVKKTETGEVETVGKKLFLMVYREIEDAQYMYDSIVAYEINHRWFVDCKDFLCPQEVEKGY